MLLLCPIKKKRYGSTKQNKQTSMPCVTPQMPKFVALTKGRINLCWYFVVDVYLMAGEHGCPDAACAFLLFLAGAPRVSGTRSLRPRNSTAGLCPGAHRIGPPRAREHLPGFPACRGTPSNPLARDSQAHTSR